MQDIAGCRVLVTELNDQERAVAVLTAAFSDHVIVDRREKPSHGYRAVHVLARVSGKLIEIQVRTRLQHLWAEVSEKRADTFDPALKYGGGDAEIKGMLLESSNLVQVSEALGKARPGDPAVQSFHDKLMRSFNEHISWLESQAEGED